MKFQNINDFLSALEQNYRLVAQTWVIVLLERHQLINKDNNE